MKKSIFTFLFLLTAASCRLIAQNQPLSLTEDTTQFSYNIPKEYIISDFDWQGADNIQDKGVLKLVTGLAEGDKVMIPGEKISEAIQNLWRQGLFEDVQCLAGPIQGNHIQLIFKVVEKPRLDFFVFTPQSNLRKSETDDLRARIKISRRKVITDYVLESTKQSIVDFFVNKGFLDCKVQIEQSESKIDKRMTVLNITVKKGPKIKIQDIFIYGNEHLKPWKLYHAMDDTKRKRIWTIFSSSKFIEDNYRKDKKSLIDKFKEKGYRDAAIVKDTVYRSAPNRVTIGITIKEGHRYYFNNINWVGNTKYSSKDLGNRLGIRKGDVFDQSLLDARLFMNPNSTDVSSLYMDDGYLFFQVTPVEVRVDNDSIDLEMRIYEGKQAIINKVTVMGNTKTNDKVIMREIRTRPGQLFRRSDIIRSQRELSVIGFFDPEKMSVNPKPNPADGTVDIEYTVQEKPSDQLELSGGWGAGRIVGTLGVSFNNFSARKAFKKSAWRPLPAGDGQRLSVRAQSNGTLYQSVNASFTEPWLGGKKPNSLTFSTYYSVQSNGLALNDVNRTSFNIWGVTTGFGSRLKKPDDYFSFFGSVNYAYYTLHNFSNIFSFSNGFSNNINVQMSISRSNLNKAPTEYVTHGGTMTLSGQFTPPYSLWENKNYAITTDQEKYKFLEFYKMKFTTQWFTPLIGNLVLNTRAGFGFLGYYNSKLGFTPFERFYLGGSGLTGYSLDGREIIAMRGYNDASLSAAHGSPLINKYTMEIRYPVTQSAAATIYGLAFVEASNTYDTFASYNPFQLYRSTGVGVRVFLPMFGLLGLDYGWRLDDVPSNPTMQRGQLHFTIGANLGEL
ncbi:MAG TPA: POTRA domain-containing protein [Bacteroidia bacterium]|jgi:outer membrane protein insertion porin family|nr:POTRA domain-containing protein [Bacteroidia bacterium]